MTPDQPATRLLAALDGVDLTCADGRAGLGALLAEIERLSPGVLPPLMGWRTDRRSRSDDVAGAQRQTGGEPHAHTDPHGSA